MSKKIWPKDGDKVLWIRPRAFGDVLEAAAGAYAFKQKYPKTHLTFLTRSIYVELIQQQPYIDDVLCWDKKFSAFPALIRSIRESKYQWVMNMHGGGSSALVTLFSGARVKLGYHKFLQPIYKTTHWAYLDALGVDFNSRPEPAIFATEQDLSRAKEMLTVLPERKVFAIIGASEAQKFWPVSHWIELIRSLTREGWGVVLNGHGPKEQENAKIISKAVDSPLVLDLVNQANFSLMAALAKSCTITMGNDTGPLHLAALVGTPTLGFFGVTDSWEMNFRMSWYREVRVSCPNAGCWNYRCPNKNCLADITPEHALNAFNSMVTEFKL